MANKVRQDLVFEKIGYDWANKKSIVRVYDALYDVVNNGDVPKTWTNVVRMMFALENNAKGLKNIAVGGYYSTIRKILKDIDVIRYENRKLVKGSNWDRFYSDNENWSWFETSTYCGGYGKIVK